MTERTTDLARLLRREWALERRLLLHDSANEGTVTGTARWSEELAGAPTELRYQERGTMRLGGHTGEVSRAYRYRFVSPVCAEVLFVDGRPFHRLDLGEGEAEIEHRCGDDVYHGLFELTSPIELRQTWNVTGPAKDYTSITVLRAYGER